MLTAVHYAVGPWKRDICRMQIPALFLNEESTRLAQRCAAKPAKNARKGSAGRRGTAGEEIATGRWRSVAGVPGQSLLLGGQDRRTGENFRHLALSRAMRRRDRIESGAQRPAPRRCGLGILKMAVSSAGIAGTGYLSIRSTGSSGRDAVLRSESERRNQQPHQDQKVTQAGLLNVAYGNPEKINAPKYFLSWSLPPELPRDDFSLGRRRRKLSGPHGILHLWTPPRCLR